MVVYYAVVKGDPLDSGGNSQVVGGNPRSTIEGPDGQEREQAYLGHEAWCAACQSFGVIVADAAISDYLRGTDETIGAKEAVGGDIVICKCERHPRVLSEYGRQVEYIDDGWKPASASAASSTGSAASRHDEQFTLRDAAGKVLRDTYYTIRMPSGGILHGVTDSRGCTGRYSTNGAQRIALYLGHREA